jgi:hypothetical protein
MILDVRILSHKRLEEYVGGCNPSADVHIFHSRQKAEGKAKGQLNP